ncbi:MAG: 4-(cytidine 5'-diphospho)-2-C-methyl-D-erythritol kinase [Solirubrobacteraceae bacterium]
MSVLRARAPGKLNLCLFVAEPREDGLHPLVSVVQALTLADELTLEPAGGDGDEVVCPGVEGPNLAARALALYREATGWDAPPQRLTIEKRIPVAAGMGGGSADAAAALRLAAHAAGRPVPPELAPRLGADVASLLRPGRVLMTGAGEHVEPLAPAPLGVLVLPVEAELSTPAVYREADRLGLTRSHAGLAQLDALVRVGTWAPENDLQDAARSLCPRIDTALDAARAAGADHVLVSGSGPTVVGLFGGADGPARAAAAASESRWPRATAAEPVDEAWAAVRG